MELPFTKMHGLGNDFMVVSWPPAVPSPTPALVRQWADRRRGIGFDSLLLLTPADSVGTSAHYRVINADGSEAQQCGNGARCLASFIRSGAPGDAVLECAAGKIATRVLADGRASVNLGVPRFDPSALPFRAAAPALRYSLTLPSGQVEFGIASLGNPHAVIATDSAATAAVGILGPEMNADPGFPEGVNVGFMEILEQDRIRLRVFERGVGETQACGTGAAAAACVGRRWGLLEQRVTVTLPGGELEVDWPGEGQPLWQTGPVATVYEGHVSL